MTVAGIDFSSNAIDVVELDNDTDAAVWMRYRLDTDAGDSFHRARSVRDVMPARGAWLDSEVVMVAIERPYSQSRRTVTALHRVEGAILACLPAEMVVLELPAQEWKRETVGTTNASKDDVAAWARATWPNVPDLVVQDAFDAYAIAWAARSICERAAAA